MCRGEYMIIMHLDDEFFNLVKSGKKVFEVRINDEKRRNIMVGNTILFKKRSNSLDGVVVKVVDRKQFNTFQEMVRLLDFGDLGMENKSVEEVLNLYYSIYDEELENKYGVVAFKIEML